MATQNSSNNADAMARRRRIIAGILTAAIVQRIIPAMTSQTVTAKPNSMTSMPIKP
jgi:hypothetical protein